MPRRLTAVLFALLFPLCVGSLAAQEYERKSISYIDALYLATPQAHKVEPEQVGFILKTVKKYIEIARFDYNPLPEPLIEDFVAAANRRDSLTVDDLAALMEAKLAPRIVDILRSAIPQRGGELVNEADRQTFLATKAKELGITLEQIEKVMNSAYIYLPVLTDLQREEKDNGKYIYTIKGGIIWFHLSMVAGEPEVRLKVAKTTVSKGFGSDHFAFQSAVKNFARNLQTAGRAIPEFKLAAPIAEVSDGNITFRLGVKEGIHVDDVFLVGEWVEDRSGEVHFNRNGWVRVGSVADNRGAGDAKSSAWAVKRGGWAPGMTLVEHPRLNIDIAWKPALSHLKVTTGRIPILIGADMKITDDYDTYAPGIDLDAHYNLGALTGLRQTFFLVGGNFTFPATLEFEPDNLTLLSSTPPFAWGLHAGVLKKWYTGQLALTADARASARFFTVEQTFILDDRYKYIISNNSVGLQVDLGLDWAASPDFNFGGFAGYRLFPVSQVWTVEIEPFLDNAVLVVDESFPEIDHSGLVFGLYFHWTPPELAIDPLSWMRGALGE